MTEPVAEMDNVSKSFDDQTVLRRLSFRIDRGEVLCILGASGSGKSVTLRLLMGLERPDDGDVRIFGCDLADADPGDLSSIRRRIGFVFQSGALFDSLTVGQNVAFPLRRHTRLRAAEIGRRVRTALGWVEMDSEIDKLPAELSGGMRKRVALSRALVLEPRLLLVDEPGAGLDPITRRSIDDLFDHLKSDRKVSMVIVTHHLSSARRLGDRIALLHDGGLVSHGVFAELAASEEPYTRDFFNVERE